MISSGEYYTISNSEGGNPLKVKDDKYVVIDSNNSTTPEDQQFLATVKSDNTSKFCFYAVSSASYIDDKSGKAYAGSSSAKYFKLTEDSDGNYSITADGDDNSYLTVSSTSSGTDAKFEKKDSKKKQKWKFIGADRRGPSPK